MKKSPLPPSFEGVALGGRYCGETMETFLGRVFVTGGVYHRTNERDQQGRFIYRWCPHSK